MSILLMGIHMVMIIDMIQLVVVYPYLWRKALDMCAEMTLSVFNQDIESLFVEITNLRSSCGKCIIVGVIYRPPDKDVHVHEFTLTMCSILEKLKTEKKAIYLSGDYNIDPLNVDKHVPISEFSDSMFSYFVYPFINRPTRRVKESATLIDNIYSNMIKNDILTGILTLIFPTIFLYFI